jgi:hypothetical protein
MHEELREDIWSLIELHRRMKSESLIPQQVPRILSRNITLEHSIRDLEGEQARLEFSNKEADLKQKDCKIIEGNEYTISQQKRDIENLSITIVNLAGGDFTTCKSATFPIDAQSTIPPQPVGSSSTLTMTIHMTNGNGRLAKSVPPPAKTIPLRMQPARWPPAVSVLSELTRTLHEDTKAD